MNITWLYPLLYKLCKKGFHIYRWVDMYVPGYLEEKNKKGFSGLLSEQPIAKHKKCLICGIAFDVDDLR